MPYNLGGARIWRIGYDVTCDGAVKREHIGLRNVSSASEQVTFSNHISSLAQSLGHTAQVSLARTIQASSAVALLLACCHHFVGFSIRYSISGNVGGALRSLPKGAVTPVDQAAAMTHRSKAVWVCRAGLQMVAPAWTLTFSIKSCPPIVLSPCGPVCTFPQYRISIAPCRWLSRTTQLRRSVPPFHFSRPKPLGNKKRERPRLGGGDGICLAAFLSFRQLIQECRMSSSILGQAMQR